MKIQNILKVTSLTILSTFLISCSQSVGNGQWQNVIKNSDGTSVTTTLAINQVQDEFTGTMTSKDSSNAEKEINFSGYISGNILVIEKLSNTTDPYFKKSTLTLSQDEKSLVLSPGGIVFNKL